MAANKHQMIIEVAYSAFQTQSILTIHVKRGITIEEAIHHSGILTLFPEIDLTQLNVGIFGSQCALTDIVYEGDRIEIYRPLLIDPKEARRAKAKTRQKNRV